MEQLAYINYNSVSNRIVLLRSIFLRLLALIYLITFASFYRQLQGLWGDEGISPAKVFINNNSDLLPKYLSMLLMHLIKQGSLLQRLLPFLNLGSEIENYFYVICLIGILFSFLVVINSKGFINMFSFFVMWLCYLNFYVILQNFRYEVDTLLLEVGFIAIFFSPLNRRNFNVITVIDNICYYFLRLLLFKVMFGVGIHVLGSKCPYWLSVNGLKYYFQSQPLPNGLSVTMHNLPDGIKKIISVLGYFIILYLPFAYFLVWRRFNIIAGQLTALFQLFIMFTGNYGHLQWIILTINLSNFDDYYLYSIIPNSIIRLFNLEELEQIVIDYLNEMHNELRKKKKKKGKIAIKDFDRENIRTLDEERMKLLQEINTSKRKLLGYGHSNSDEEDDAYKIEELFLDENSRSSIAKEAFIFFNILAVLMVFIIFYLFPLRKILSEDYHIPELSIKSWEYMMNIYMIILFIYFIAIITYNLVQRFKIFSTKMDQTDNDSDDTMSQIITGFSFLYYFLSYFVIIAIIIMYYLANVNSLFSGIGLSLVDKKKDNIMSFSSPIRNLFDSSVLFSENAFKKLYAVHPYYGIQRRIRGIEGRAELEIEYLNEAGTQWETIEFSYKVNIKSKPKSVSPYLPRLDYLMTKAANTESINSSTWLAILTGKIFERNEVVMDLLGYEIPQKAFFYKMSLFDRITNSLIGIARKQVPNEIKKIKIERYLYEFVNKTEHEGKLMKRKYNWEFLGNIEKYAINPIFQRANLPEIIHERNIAINSFQFIPIIDLLIIICLFRILY